MPPPPTDQAKLTAGVSYVVHTESRQIGADGMAQLPHLVFQPPGLKEVAGSHVNALVQTISTTVTGGPLLVATIAAVLPLREENHMKSYLLLPAGRRELLHQQGGRLVEASAGARGVESLLQDRSFICLHYHLDQQGQLHPVSTTPASAGSNGTAVRYSVEQSAARQLGGGGLLSALLDDAPLPLAAPGTSAAAATAEPDPALSSQPLAQLSTAELEVALHKAAAELRAAEVTAAAAEAAGDHEMPDFEAEDAAEDAAAAAATAAEGYSTEDGVSHVAKFAVAELEGEQGLEELLQEMQEEEQHWHQEELGQNQAQQQPPRWMRQKVEAPLVGAGLVAPGFCDSIALNIYHDGSEGIQSHYDDAARFCQPILSLRLFSDMMEEGGYAANGIKHCVRPMDMSGKSAGMILRRINPPAPALQRCWPNGMQRQAASVPGSAGPLEAQHVGHAYHLLSELVRRVEHLERQEKMEDVTAQLMLLSALRKVEAADRLGFSLCATDAKEASSSEAAAAACVFRASNGAL
ncbi:hypothetical protein CHLNCDRAFT_136563 [Chlorella variabilis]|uniref:Uncharacterized protein n=1 Tax=Chlorella variabilis TaxID=554065 RepID=E1ZKL9_CHLVA|nr:hypothetical protein CHLNCDRAFT_136563 [Chlorella variabilis]EFN53716.1 hypothetical protein CHLNCDRAFT_136563 [Chlorella variabilis]|eukprot:XP_005845818.1 hypothetical protein CHLNCDRAFT_136563 [Chlorella variabilis]